MYVLRCTCKNVARCSLTYVITRDDTLDNKRSTPTAFPLRLNDVISCRYLIFITDPQLFPTALPRSIRTKDNRASVTVYTRV